MTFRPSTALPALLVAPAAREATARAGASRGGA